MLATARNQWTFLLLLAVLLLVVVLVGMNEAGVQQAQEMCRNAGGVPEVSRGYFVIQPEFQCKGINY
ncbi:hypothetical protein [Alkalicoccus daliensis]|uniref:Uncharacterized protein n=1 Tax=Alkalicoccus daliensis TaxID=745820 RepID=A0A1H0ECD5_9BACI|nr:hypothetical protein [Alkalicoccus daliensis]SDN79989.1 hypothetical protein SAMN04488053_103280 [Alkalicoccus daliensis]